MVYGILANIYTDNFPSFWNVIVLMTKNCFNDFDNVKKCIENAVTNKNVKLHVSQFMVLRYRETIVGNMLEFLCHQFESSTLIECQWCDWQTVIHHHYSAEINEHNFIMNWKFLVLWRIAKYIAYILILQNLDWETYLLFDAQLYFD